MQISGPIIFVFGVRYFVFELALQEGYVDKEYQKV